MCSHFGRNDCLPGECRWILLRFSGNSAIDISYFLIGNIQFLETNMKTCWELLHYCETLVNNFINRVCSSCAADKQHLYSQLHLYTAGEHWWYCLVILFLRVYIYIYSWWRKIINIACILCYFYFYLTRDDLHKKWLVKFFLNGKRIKLFFCTVIVSCYFATVK